TTASSSPPSDPAPMPRAGQTRNEGGQSMRVALLTGGGDCPGLNPALRGIVMRGLDHGFEMLGVEMGWRGLVDNLTRPLTLEAVEEIIWRGGTILGSSRTNPFR